MTSATYAAPQGGFRIFPGRGGARAGARAAWMRGGPYGGRGEYGFGGPRGFGGHRGFGGPRGRGGRARRGDVRTAALLLLAEEPRNGYTIMQEIEQRSGGVWTL